MAEGLKMDQFDEAPARSCFNAATVRIERIFDELSKHHKFDVADEFLKKLYALVDDAEFSLREGNSQYNATLDLVKEWFCNLKIYIERKNDTDWGDDDENVRRICIEAVKNRHTGASHD